MFIYNDNFKKQQYVVFWWKVCDVNVRTFLRRDSDEMEQFL